MSRRAVVVLLVFVASFATGGAGFWLVGSAPDVALWLILGGIFLFVAACFGIGFLRPAMTDEEAAAALRSGSRGNDSSWLSSIADVFR